MKKLIYNENTKEIDIIKENKRGIKKIKGFFEENKIFVEIYSLFFLGTMGVVLSFVGININNETMEIYEKQLEIEEKNMEPFFTLECKNIWEKVEETEGTDKIAKCQYTLTNNGRSITNAHVWVESDIIFYIPTGVENEWYIFNYKTNKVRYIRSVN